MDGGVKTAIYILNRVPSKSVPKTLYVLWTVREPSLNHFRVWGCLAEAKIFNPNTRKLDPKIVNCHFIGYPEKSKGYRFYCPCHFIGYPEKSKGYRFYCPDRHMKFTDTRHTAFLEDQMTRGSMVARKIDLEEKRVFVPTPMSQEHGCGTDRAPID